MDALKDVELLQVLVGETLAKEVFKAYDNDIRVLAKFIGSRKVEGCGNQKEKIIKAAFELGRRKEKYDEIDRFNAQVITNSRAVFVQFNKDLSDLDHEELWALYLSKNGRILQKKRISEGGTDYTSADIKKIVRPAIDLMASNVAICHNHPHSTTRPSQDDKVLTKKVKEALELFDIRLLDHIVVSDGRYYSFAENGDM